MAGQLVLEHEALQRRPVAAAVGLRPVTDDPALGVQQAHPLQVVVLVQHLVPMGFVAQGRRHLVPAELADLFSQALCPIA
ncbi:hypothetical protein D3C75_1174840 [compost metagenome]